MINIKIKIMITYITKIIITKEIITIRDIRILIHLEIIIIIIIIINIIL